MPSAPQVVVAAPTDGWTRLQQAAGTLAALGTLAVIVFTWLSLQQVDNEQALIRNEHALTREGQVTDRYNNAVGNIGEDALEVRLGGIYALQRIMEDSPRDQPSIVNVLSTYIRNHAKKPKQETADSPEPTSDVQAALTALRSRDPDHDGTALIDLRGAHLVGANLPRAHLDGADLKGANLPRAVLDGAYLVGAKLESMNLSSVRLMDANLTNANLMGANLTDASLTYANLTDANLMAVNLTDASLTNANLTDTYLRGADLTDADLTDANLTNANLAYANLTGANLRGADLSHADLTGAKR